MKLNIETKITINSTSSEVWKVFSDFSNYPNWNPFVKSLTGDIKEGSQISIVLPDMNFKPTVLKFEKDKELRWVGKLLFKGLFDGEHYFCLEDNGNGTTSFVHGENFSGILVGPFKKKLMNETRNGFIEMNEKLKEQVEGDS